MGYAPTFSIFLGLALVFGLVSGGSLTLGYSIGSRKFGEAARGAFFGRLSGAALIGGAVAPAIAASVARSSLPNVYWMNALVYASERKLGNWVTSSPPGFKTRRASRR